MTVSRSSDARGQRTSGRVGSRLAAFAETTQALGLKQPIRFARRSGPPLDLPPFQRSRHGRTNPSLGGLPATGGRTGALPPPRVQPKHASGKPQQEPLASPHRYRGSSSPGSYVGRTDSRSASGPVQTPVVAVVDRSGKVPQAVRKRFLSVLDKMLDDGRFRVSEIGSVPVVDA